MAENRQLKRIFDRALSKLQEGEFDVAVADQKDCEIHGTERWSDEEEVLHWMLAKWLKDHKRKFAYSQDFAYIKIPKGVQFPTSDISLREIVYFSSPQTELTWAHNHRI
jgi:hypothetical protein